jgi:uncharacterized membrane protein
MKKIKITDMILVGIAAHLMYSNSMLLIDREILVKGSISFFEIAIMILFASSYSVVTALSLRKLRKLIFVLFFALLDGIAVYLRINVYQEYFVIIVAIFFAVYTFYIILIAYILERQENNIKKKEPESKQEPEIKNIESKILKLKEAGISQKEIAVNLGVSESKICRILKKLK